MKKFIATLLLVVVFLLAACQNNEPAPTAVPPTTTPVEDVETETAVEPTEEPTAEPIVEPSTETSTDEEMAPLPDEIVTQLDDFLQSQVYTEGADPSTTAPGLVLLVDTPDGQYLQAAGVARVHEQVVIEFE